MFEFDGRATYPPTTAGRARRVRRIRHDVRDGAAGRRSLITPPAPDVASVRWDQFYSRAMRELSRSGRSSSAPSATRGSIRSATTTSATPSRERSATCRRRSVSASADARSLLRLHRRRDRRRDGAACAGRSAAGRLRLRHAAGRARSSTPRAACCAIRTSAARTRARRTASCWPTAPRSRRPQAARIDRRRHADDSVFSGVPIGRDMDGYARADLFTAFSPERPITFIPHMAGEIPDYDRFMMCVSDTVWPFAADVHRHSSARNILASRPAIQGVRRRRRGSGDPCVVRCGATGARRAGRRQRCGCSSTANTRSTCCSRVGRKTPIITSRSGRLEPGDHRLRIEADAASFVEASGRHSRLSQSTSWSSPLPATTSWRSRWRRSSMRVRTPSAGSPICRCSCGTRSSRCREGRQFRYSVIFTNEDGGTATDRLMATWGRTTDVEFVYGVTLDRAGTRWSPRSSRARATKCRRFADAMKAAHPCCGSRPTTTW